MLSGPVFKDRSPDPPEPDECPDCGSAVIGDKHERTVDCSQCGWGVGFDWDAEAEARAEARADAYDEECY